MSEELSPRGDITGNMYTDLGAETREAYEISKKSRRFARHMIGDRNDEDRIRQRCAIAVGDLSMADLVRFIHDPVPAGLSALEKRSPLITDIRMVQVGIQKKGHESPVRCVLDRDLTPFQNQEVTRTSAGFLSYGDELEGCIIVIGNAPSALLTVCRMVGEGVRPALVVGTPVGFVNACESKEMLRSLDVPSISTAGTRGGTPVAVAAMNEIVTLYAERKGIHHETDH